MRVMADLWKNILVQWEIPKLKATYNTTSINIILSQDLFILSQVQERLRHPLAIGWPSHATLGPPTTRNANGIWLFFEERSPLFNVWEPSPTWSIESILLFPRNKCLKVYMVDSNESYCKVDHLIPCGPLPLFFLHSLLSNVSSISSTDSAALTTFLQLILCFPLFYFPIVFLLTFKHLPHPLTRLSHLNPNSPISSLSFVVPCLFNNMPHTEVQ